MAETKDYVGITRNALDCLKERLQSRGIAPFAGDGGTVEQQGVKLAVAYIEAEQKLQFDIIDKPSFIPEDLVWTLLDTAVSGCTGD